MKEEMESEDWWIKKIVRYAKSKYGRQRVRNSLLLVGLDTFWSEAELKRIQRGVDDGTIGLPYYVQVMKEDNERE